MPRTIFNANPSSGTTGSTGIRQWGQAISTAFAAVGLVKTADTGQINWSTVVTPAAGSMAGYEIWRFADTAQATAPLIFKIEYGTGGQTSYPAINLLVGKGSDGTGAITSPLQAVVGLATSSHSPTVASNSYVSSDGSSLALYMWPGEAESVSSLPFSFVIERSRTPTGTATAEGVLILSQTNAATAIWTVRQYVSPTAMVQWTGVSSPISLPNSINGVKTNTSSSAASDATHAPAIPIPLYAPGVTPWASQTLVVVLPGDGGGGGLPVCTINGAAHQYRAVGNTTGGNGSITSGTIAHSVFPCIWWEA